MTTKVVIDGQIQTFKYLANEMLTFREVYMDNGINNFININGIIRRLLEGICPKVYN
jgi:hypothetical protein